MPPKQLEHTLNFEFLFGTRLFVVKLFQYCSEDFLVGTGFVGNSVLDKSVVSAVVFTGVCTSPAVAVAGVVVVADFDVAAAVEIVVDVDVNADDVDTEVSSTSGFV